MVHLQAPLSSATAHPGELFTAMVDEPVVAEGQTFIPPGTIAHGRVLEAKAATAGADFWPTSGTANSIEPGYLRIVLVSLDLRGRPLTIETFSVFAKGGARDEPNLATPLRPGQRDGERVHDRDIVFAPDRQLSFRLAAAVDVGRPIP